MKVNPYLITGPMLLPLADWLHKRHRKHKAVCTTNAIENLQRLYRLKETSVITEEEFKYQKSKLMEQI